MSFIRITLSTAAIAILLWGAVANAAGGQERSADAYKSGREAKDVKIRRAHFTRGMKVARELLEKDKTSVEGMFWLAVNMGAEAIDRGKMSALPVVPEMEKLLLKAFEADPKYESGGAARVLGRLYHQAPAVISVGSNDKARIYLKASMEAAPDHPGNLAFSSDFMLNVDGKDKAARKLAERCLAILDQKDFGSDEDEWRTIAKEVLEETE